MLEVHGSVETGVTQSVRSSARQHLEDLTWSAVDCQHGSHDRPSRDAGQRLQIPVRYYNSRMAVQLIETVLASTTATFASSNENGYLLLLYTLVWLPSSSVPPLSVHCL